MKTGPKPKKPIDRFNKHILKTSCGCWIWLGGTYSNHYGSFRIGSLSDNTRKQVLAHRWSYEFHKGPIPDNLFVCHTCDTPSCVNPDHLWTGTRSENSLDMYNKGRMNNTYLKGSEKPNSIFTEIDILKIRELSKTGLSYSEISKIYNSSKSAIADIVKRRSWRHVS